MQSLVDRHCYTSFACSETHPLCGIPKAAFISPEAGNNMQELAPIHDSTPRDHGRTIGGYELFTGLSASGSAKQHNGDVYNNSEHRTSIK
jgi:hypothetical protein